MSQQQELERVAAFWDNRPCNIRHSLAEIGTRQYFDEVEERRYRVEPHIPIFADFERWHGKRVLEIGCGIGTDGANFARHGADYTAIELSEISLKLTIRQFEVYGLKVRFIQGNAEALSAVVGHNAFDLVYAFGVIHHSPNQRAIVKEIRKVIREDGEFRCMLYAKNSWKDMMIDAGFDQPEAQRGCPIAPTYTKDMLVELLDGQFELRSLEQAHIFPYNIEKYVNYEYELEPWFEAMPPAMFHALKKRLGWHLLITAAPV
jgi:SAM-dependent methyltransferase